MDTFLQLLENAAHPKATKTDIKKLVDYLGPLDLSKKHNSIPNQLPSHSIQDAKDLLSAYVDQDKLEKIKLSTDIDVHNSIEIFIAPEFA